VDPSLLSPLEHRGDAGQRVLLAIRARAQLVKTRTALMHSARGMLKNFGLRLPQAHSEDFVERARQAVPAELLSQLEGLFRIVGEVTKEIVKCDELVEEIARSSIRRCSGCERFRE
jgi:transposase